MFSRVTILGVGLIGASFGLALKKSGLCRHITGCGRSPANLKTALSKGAIDSFTTDPAEACRDSDLVMLAAPVSGFSDLISAISGDLKKGAIVTDAGSVKGGLVEKLEGLMPEGVFFIGGHPIAGGELSGAEAAVEGLFLGARCIITPTPRSDRTALKKVSDMWSTLGAVVSEMDPFEHDRVYAAVSHLPHLIAYSVVNTVSEIDPGYLELAGQGFRDMTRIAGSRPALWRDICMMNRDNLTEMLCVFRRNIDELEASLKAGDSGALEEILNRAYELRGSIGQD